MQSAHSQSGATSINPEQAVIDRIDELVNEQLAGYESRSGYDYNVGVATCERCGDDWHGLANAYCPGPFGTDEQVSAEQARERENGLADITTLQSMMWDWRDTTATLVYFAMAEADSLQGFLVVVRDWRMAADGYVELSVINGGHFIVVPFTVMVPQPTDTWAPGDRMAHVWKCRSFIDWISTGTPMVHIGHCDDPDALTITNGRWGDPSFDPRTRSWTAARYWPTTVRFPFVLDASQLVFDTGTE